MIRSETIRSPVSPWTLGSSRPPSALTMIVGRRGPARRCAIAGPIRAAAPAVARKARRPSSVVVIAGLLRSNQAVIGPVEAAAALHGEQDRAHIGDVRDGIALEHDHV